MAYLTNPDYRKNKCCMMHNVIGLPKDPITRKEIPLTTEQLDFAKRALTFGNRKQMIIELASALRKRNDIERGREMKKIAATILPDLEDDYMPTLPKDRIEWEKFCRPSIKGELNRLEYLPMMVGIVRDNHPFQMYLLARQWGKSTMIANDMAYHATTKYDFDQSYFIGKNDLLTTFTESKFRQPVFGEGPLSHYISGLSNRNSIIKKVTIPRMGIKKTLP